MSRIRTALALGLLLAAAAVAGQAQQTKPAPQAPEPMTVREVAKDLYLVKGGAGANSAFFVTPKQGVIVIDAKMTPEAAAEMLGDISKVTSQPVRTIILTHSDGDHVNGLPGFPKGLEILAHENVKRDMEKAAVEMPALKDHLPTRTYSSGASLAGPGYKIDLRHFGPAHTDGDTCVLFPDLGAAFVGDLIFVGRDPLVHRQKGGTTSGYVKTLQDLLAVEPPVKTFLSGHSDPLTRADVEALRASLAEKLAKVKEMVSAGKTLDDVRKAFGIEDAPGGGRPRWPSFVETAYLELTGK